MASIVRYRSHTFGSSSVDVGDTAVVDSRLGVASLTALHACAMRPTGQVSQSSDFLSILGDSIYDWT